MSRLPGSSNEEQILFLVRWLNDHIKDAQSIQKPVLFAEFGVATKNMSTDSTTVRDQFFNLVYSAIYSSASDSGAAILSCSRASEYGLMKIDRKGRITQFLENPNESDVNAMRVDTSVLGLSAEEAEKYPFISPMGVSVFRTETLLKLLRLTCPSGNDLGSEIIPSSLRDHKVQAYMFRDYWKDIGTIKSFYEANLELTEQSPKFELIQHSVVGVRSRLEAGSELLDTMMMGADLYQTDSEIATLLAEGKVPIGVGENTKIRNCIIDKNAKIGRNVIIANADGVQEADRPKEGFYIRSGIVVIVKNATIEDGTVI
ncbi:unnamed protein product [Sphenostylis stenocarpa]|uniref:glucose-1-phosphate adenylyltransferase n=1 Tax=Sphenostylis stenocarpa TaxID=92480 RepID=A0AA86T1B4_9FABA|nr:unnamed protein product [Sphenostylis stenocarpa]